MSNKPGVTERSDFYKALFETTLTPNQENRANHLREAYRIGQRLYRWVLDQGRKPDEDDLSHYLQGLDSNDEVSREGFLMGWQSDAYATDHDLELSVEGQTRIMLNEKDTERSNEYTREAEADSILFGSSSD